MTDDDEMRALRKLSPQSRHRLVQLLCPGPHNEPAGPADNDVVHEFVEQGILDGTSLKPTPFGMACAVRLSRRRALQSFVFLQRNQEHGKLMRMADHKLKGSKV